MLLARVQALLVQGYLRSCPREFRLEKYQDLIKGRDWLSAAIDESGIELFPEEVKPVQEEVGFDDSIVRPIGKFPPAAGNQSLQSLYVQYLCTQNNPLQCSRSGGTETQDEIESLTLSQNSPQSLSQNLSPILSQCSLCKFPAPLTEKMKIRGKNGIYAIDRSMGRRGLGRLYGGTLQDTKQAIVLKEYLLPSRYFNVAEKRATQDTIKKLAGLSLLGSPGQDFRILSPIEVISDGDDERCYVILDERSTNPTLNQTLQKTGVLSTDTVRSLLNQILQILEVLHEQKFQLPLGQIQSGLVHGNLNLDTVLIKADATAATTNATTSATKTLTKTLTKTSTVPQKSITLRPSNFFVYLSDLMLWESLCKTPLMKLPEQSITQDLINVGYIGFYALNGGAIDATGKALDPECPEHWSQSTPALTAFLRRLLGLASRFPTAAEARQALLQIPIDAPIVATDVAEAIAPPKSKWTKVAAFATLFLILGVAAFPLLKTRKPAAIAMAPVETPILAEMKAVGAIPMGEFRYTAVQNGTWNYILQTADLIESGQTLERKIQTAQPKLTLKFEPSVSLDAAIAAVRSGKSAFAIVPLNQSVPEDLEFQPIAYDGLAVFVSFSYSLRDQGLPKALKGTLSIDQLQKIYTGKVGNWKTLTAANLPVKSYQSDDPELVTLFEQRLFNGQLPSDFSLKDTPKPPNFFELLRSVLRDFESNNTGSIGFAPFSRVFGQCSVYPLAIQANGKSPVQPMVLSTGPAIEPTTNLCDRKGNYNIDPKMFRSGEYPLAYPIGVMYARRNDRPIVGVKFAEMMRTKEGQRLLKQTGLVPAIEE